MRRLPILMGAFLVLAVAGESLAAPGLVSKTFVFKPDTELEVDADVQGVLRIKTVRFLRSRSGGSMNVEVAIANTSGAPQGVDIAVALFDEEGLLVGVASGGSRLMTIKPGRRSYYVLGVEDVAGATARAAKFQISVAPRR